MADYWTQATFQPTVLLTEAELAMLRRCGAEADGPDEHGKYYVYVQDGFSPFYTENDDPQDLSALADEAKAVLAPKSSLEDVSGDSFITFVLQRALRRMPADIHSITAEVAFTCSKMRPDGFGGAWYVITRSRIVIGSTSEEAQRLAGLEASGLSLDIPRRAFGMYQALRKIAENRLPSERGHRRLDGQDAKNFIRIARRAIQPLKTKERQHEQI